MTSISNGPSTHSGIRYWNRDTLATAEPLSWCRLSPSVVPHIWCKIVSGHTGIVNQRKQCTESFDVGMSVRKQGEVDESCEGVGLSHEVEGLDGDIFYKRA
ncbi:hypothetical protein VNO78_08398 [Psophocarpus tetragonolobus]|uniref:Uncharacterized protein n=1 Tax=Psophocarpus tetragonolobus TaxID=3891 RepID=A0AAN9T5N8_PSOTE